jgi:hypothetical protein
VPDVPDYELVDPPFGEGAYGKVWVVRNAVGQWQALKAIYLARFGTTTDRTIASSVAFSDTNRSPTNIPVALRGLRQPEEAGRILLLRHGTGRCRRRPAGNRIQPLTNPAIWRSIRAQADGRRLSVSQCVGIGLALTMRCNFLHDTD